jgi:hypothetical protein
MLLRATPANSHDADEAVTPMDLPIVSASSSGSVFSDLRPQKYRARSRLEVLGRASCNHSCAFHCATLANGAEEVKHQDCLVVLKAGPLEAEMA